MPTGNGDVLMTTRYKWLAIRKGGHMHELCTFPPDLSLTMFMGLCKMWEQENDGASEQSEMEIFLEEFGSLALAIEQIAAYVSSRNVPIAKFRKQYARSSQRIHTNSEASPSDKSLAKLWDVQFEEIGDKPGDSIPLNLSTPDEEEDSEISDMIGFPDEEYVFGQTIQQTNEE
ncbi:hypothetical protein AUP68_17885 [Ilyonectria robusta]